MRHASLCSAIFVATILLVAPATVNAATWCLVTRDGGSLCRFHTFEQCMQSRSGRGDSCAQDSSTEAAPSKARTKASGADSKKAAPAAASKQEPAKSQPQEQPVKQVIPAQPRAAPVPKSEATAPEESARKFAAARDLVLAGRYEAGIAALHALGFDKHPDVAVYMGLAHNKLGRLGEARSWYEKALVSSPNHLLALSYYGMLRAEQGELSAAQDDLEKIKRICAGTGCKEYIALDGVIASKRR